MHVSYRCTASTMIITKSIQIYNYSRITMTKSYLSTWMKMCCINSSHTIHHMQICHSTVTARNPDYASVMTFLRLWMRPHVFTSAEYVIVRFAYGTNYIVILARLFLRLWTIHSWFFMYTLYWLGHHHLYPWTLFLVSCNPIVTRYSWWSNIPHIYPSIFGLTSTAEHNDMSLLINPYLVRNNFPLFLLC